MTVATQETTVFHITHWKAGSQWIHRILRDIFKSRVVAPKLMNQQYMEDPLVQGGVYPTVYITREVFESISIPFDYKRFVIVRDLRDTLISGYFSVRYSHVLVDDLLLSWRQRLENMTLEDGLLMMVDEWLPASAKIQQSWLNSPDDDVYRYEDLLKNDLEIIEEILIQQCGLNIDPNLLKTVIEKNRFEAITQGRKPGDEDILSHQRKGIHGDWKNYFTPTVEARVTERYGELLAGLGYQ